MGKRKAKKTNRLRNWLIIIGLSLIMLLSIAFIFRRPIIYYTKYVYHKIVPAKRLKEVPSSNTKTNLYIDVQLPKAEVYGIDISRHQGVINWKRLSEFRFRYHKIDFIYIKATESVEWVDDKFAKNWRNAKKHNFIRGAYHFFDPEFSAELQMKNFFAKVKLHKGDLPPMLDVEQESKIMTSSYRKKVIKCLTLMEQHYGIRPILYTNQSFYDSYFSTTDFKKYSLWLSRLKITEPKQQNWVIWQFSHTAVVPGIDEYVDFNVFNGTINKFKILQKK